MSRTDRAVLWDLDGTLVDSEEVHWFAWQQVLAAEGVRVTYQQFLASFGRINAAFLPEWLGPGGTPADVDRIGSVKEEVYRRLLAERGCPLLPGAAAWLERLQREGWLQAVASSAPRLNVEAMLSGAGIARYFAATVAAEDVDAGKPEPQVFLKAAARVGVPPLRSIVVEDAAAGVEGAHRAGMRAIGVRRAAAGLGADLEVRSLTDLPADAFTGLLAGAGSSS